MAVAREVLLRYMVGDPTGAKWDEATLTASGLLELEPTNNYMCAALILDAWIAELSGDNVSYSMPDGHSTDRKGIVAAKTALAVRYRALSEHHRSPHFEEVAGKFDVDVVGVETTVYEETG